ncbi:hypothetical protein AMELA_G00084410 [Ameiurus melas]|uniref:Ig-like domain-containing protein n=1 Tax=Ameiurus melas TaxID=219545 RepID=A0A7J6B0D0_AMEME|nr:hypothetical protein AMELA_G00084410 [Ameiurus melas]
MERMISGRVWLACVSLFFTLQVCLGSVSVKVTPTVDVIIGETARLPCSYNTTGTMAVVQWFIESAGTRKRVAFRSSTGAGLDKDTPLTDRGNMETDMTLVISPIKVMDQRSFFCQVDGGPVGTSEAETKLRVFFAPEKPVVSENTQVIPLTPNNPVAHRVGKCTSNKGHPEPRIIWFKDSKPLPEGTDPKEKIYMVPSVVKESSGLFTVTSTLYIQPEKIDAKSVFHCTVEYSLPNDIKKENSEPFNLTLLYPAENVFFKLLNMSQIKEGDDVQMKCETDGNPQPQFEFTKDGKALASGSGLFILRNVTRSDSGTYMCEAQDFDADNIELTKTLNITVQYLDPVSVEPASPLIIKKGDQTDLQCKTRSSDEYTLSWMKDGKQLIQKGVLTLLSTNLDDDGEYVCVALVPSVPGLRKQANITVTVSVHLLPSGKVSLVVNGNTFTSIVTLEATAAVIKDGVTCEATNMHGTDSKKIMVEIQSDNTVKQHNGVKGSPVFAAADTQQGGSKGVVAAVLVCVLLLLLLVAALYFLSQRGRMACRKKEIKEVTSGEEMKSGKNEESGLLNKPPVEP